MALEAILEFEGLMHIHHLGVFAVTDIAGKRVGAKKKKHGT